MSYPPMDFGHGVMVQVFREGERDIHGDLLDGVTPVDPWGTVHHTIGPCDVAWSASELTDIGETVIVRASMTGPAGADLLATDRVKIGTQKFHIEGDVTNPRNPVTGWSAGVRFKIVRVK